MRWNLYVMSVTFISPDFELVRVRAGEGALGVGVRRVRRVGPEKTA